MNVQACPCGRLDVKKRSIAYVDCCGRFIEHLYEENAPDAEHLMRSRYSAFVFERRDYLLATWHSSTRPEVLDFDAGVKWLGLVVNKYTITAHETAEVEFVARYRLNGRAVRMQERSYFVRENGRWVYVDGQLH